MDEMVTQHGQPYCVGCSYGRHEECVKPCPCTGTCEVWPGRDWELKHRSKETDAERENIVDVPNVFPEDWV